MYSYQIGYSVKWYDKGKLISGIDTIYKKMDSDAEVIKYAFAFLLKRYPVHQGYFNHHVTIIESLQRQVYSGRVIG